MGKNIKFLQGNETCVEAALYAGLDFFAGYPITPSSEIAEHMAKRLPQIGDSDLVFTTNETTPVSGFSRAKTRLDALMGDPPEWLLHDLRRTATTGMARLGTAPHVVDKILNHTAGTIRGVAAIYNRYQFEPERKAALEAWARFVESLVRPSPSNVVGLRPGIRSGG